MNKLVIKVFLFSYCLLAIGAGTIHAQGGEARLRNLGPQIRASVIQGSIFLKDNQGRDMVYTVVRGNPAHLLGYTLDDHKLVFDKPLAGSDGAWDLAVSSDGLLYIPGAKGSLYKHRPGTQELKNLGIVLPGETTVWNLSAGKNGEMFGATYPGCRVFRYHPDQGFSDVGKGPLVAGESYVRSLAYYAKTGKLYAGIGSHADLIELDPITGEKTSILPERFRNKEFVYSLEILEGVNGGDRLLALITNGSFTLVYNLKTREFEYEITEMDMKAVSQPDASGLFYYTLKSALYGREIDNTKKEPVKYNDTAGSANAIRVSGNRLDLLNADGDVVTMDLTTKATTCAKLEIPGQPISLQTIMKGPDGRIWSGGYLAGGHGTYDPKTGEVTSYPGLHQTEGMTVKGKYIYFGIYPKGLYYEYDSSKPWNLTAKNPRFIGQIPDQSRSFAVLNSEKNKKIFFGMVPEYGQLGGHLVSYDTDLQKLQTYGQIIPSQSIVSLVDNGNLIWGGTTVSGGLGVKPVTEEAKLFSWDVKNQKVVDELVPVAGAKAITTMITGPDGNIWGMAGGTLFVFDPAQKKVTRSVVLYPTPPLTSHVWRDAFLVLHKSGVVYGTGNNQLFSIDPVSLKFQWLARPASLLAMDDGGKLYFHRSAELWQFTP